MRLRLVSAIGRLGVGLVLAVLGLEAARAEEAAAPVSTPSKVLFETHVAPLLEANCFKCHGATKQEGGLDLRRKRTMLKGGDSGAAIVDGKPDESLLVEKIDKGEMPPPKEGKLEEAERALIRRWVAGGALLVNTNEPADEVTEVVSRVTDEDRQFWSFQPPRRPDVPSVKNADRVRTPVDAFLLAKLEEKGLSFNPDADKATWLRRLCIDLLGLPPTLEQLDEFLADNEPNAYERLVDRLLKSPHYGERWARHWLDIAGYADSDGYLAADRLRTEAWRYRDYVIQALNEDLPYDRFVIEQLAGDELSDWRRTDELTPEMQRQLTATGFLRTASDPTYPGYIEPNEVHQVMADTMQIVSSTFLGLTVHCARCHSHKFDPVSQRDYYSLQTIFLPALDPARWQPSEVRGIPLATEPQLARVTATNQKVDARVNELNAAINEMTTTHRRKLLREKLGAERVTKLDEAKLDAATLDKLAAAVFTPADKRNAEQKTLVMQHGADIALTDADLVARFPEYKPDLDRLSAAVTAEQAIKKPTTLVRGLTDVDDKPAVGRVLVRGEHSKPGAEVLPSVPEVLIPAGQRFDAQPAYKTTGRRLALARWLTNPAHPLTARVHVNRIWRDHMGRGLVPTVANFGRSGAKPTHPELLDWLATEFIRLGWSQKELHRLIVTSTAYRQTASSDSAKLAADPGNVLLGAWQPRRVEGEVLRDSTLAVANKLNLEMLGKPSAVAPQGDGSVITSDDAAGNRRSIYLIVRRSQHLTMLDLFDTPMMEINCVERNSSTVPLQALAMLHGSFAERSAVALANQILATSPPDEAARLRFAYRLLFTREPKPTETAAITEFLAAAANDQLGTKAATATDDERTAAHKAAWVQAALVLLNSNEFLYVR
ncbi:MAG: PSD1 and planctomycete cytochrome C domain-containing protein [Planctomycetota bacterium]